MLRSVRNDGASSYPFLFAFTAIDRLASGGISMKGNRWRRKYDVAGTSFTAGGLSAVHREYLAAGGQDFLIGDGALTGAGSVVIKDVPAGERVAGNPARPLPKK